jgi:CDP-glucose 4,6-dehydratase
MLEKFKGKRIFITGSTGFKGSWLSYVLYLSGAEVLGYALPPSLDNRSLFRDIDLNNKIEQIEGNVCNRDKLISTLVNFKPDFVFHLAAQALVRPSYEDPFSTFETNVMGSVNLLDAVLASKSVRSLVYITSDKCYENNEWIWGYRENDMLGGRDPYSASKAAAEHIFSAYYRSFISKLDSLGAASVRAGNVIGGGDWALDRIVPDCIRYIEKNEPITLRSPNATRPWQHVLEPLSGYLLLALKLYSNPSKYSGSWNFGPSTKETATVEDLARFIVEDFGKGEIINNSESEQPHEAGLLQLNCDKSHQMLNWSPTWSIEKTFHYTSNWYKKFLSNENLEIITKNQINKYFGEMNDRRS